MRAFRRREEEEEEEKEKGKKQKKVEACAETLLETLPCLPWSLQSHGIADFCNNALFLSIFVWSRLPCNPTVRGMLMGRSRTFRAL